MWYLIRPGMYSSCLQILILLSLTGAAITFNERKCFELPVDSKCKSTYQLNVCIIQCPTVKIIIASTRERIDVVLECISENLIENKLLPKMNIGSCHFVGIDNCQLSGKPIALLLEQLGLKNFKLLVFIRNTIGANLSRLLTGLRELEELTFGLNKILLLPSDIFIDLSNVTTLTIQENLVKLPPHIFDPLEKLTKLDLAYNSLNQLPTGIFRNQHQLEELKLNNNELRNINKTTFEGATSLQILDLSNNNLSRFVPEIFSLLPTLSEIYLGGNEFRELPSHLFANNANLTILRIDENRNTLEFVPSELFANLSHLQEVQISCSNYSSNKNKNCPFSQKNENLICISCGFRDIPGDLFTSSSNWTLVSLAGNNLRLIPDKIFADQHNLNWLDLSHNMLQSLQHNLFRNISSLILLDLSYNLLTELPDEIFLSLGSLERPRLDNNELHSLPDGFFNKTTNLVELKLSYNKLLRISAEIFSPLVKLEELYLDNNELHALPDRLFLKTTNLVELKLSYNQLTELSAQIFSSLDKLERLYLDNNKLHLLPDGLYLKTTNLVELNLSYNQLIEISAKIFSPLVKLELLYLDNNHLMTISPDAFSESRNIRYISMENNRIKLQEIALVKTPFHLLEKLETLKLRNNSIQHIYWDWRTALPNLKELDLSLNNIAKLDTRDLTFQQNGILVNMSQNQVRTIGFEIENLITETSNCLIDLSYNPLDCDCKLLSFLLHLRRIPDSKPRFITDSLYCDNPYDRRLQLFRDFKPEELTCFNENCPHGCFCWERTYDATLIFNCSNTNLTKVPVLPVVQTIAFKAIELHIENNELLELSTISFDGYAAVTKIYATGNNIFQIAVQNLPMKLTHLDLSYNNLKRLDLDVIDFFNTSHSLIQLTLAGNPWECICESRSFYLFAERQSIVTDYKEMFCGTAKNATIHNYFIDNELCQENHGVIFISIVSVLSVSLLFAIIVIVSYKYETEIKIWMYSCPWLRGIVSEFDVDKDKKYDAFVSYSHQDQEFIGTILVPELERDGPIHFKLCIHVRDFIVGEYITDQIIRAIDESRRTIIVLSKHFIQSVWACLEFRLAHQAAVEEGRTRIIVIMYGDIGDIDSLEPILRTYLKTNTYLEWGDPQFWDRLRYAMTHSINALPNATSEATTAV